MEPILFTTRMEWQDLILSPKTTSALEMIDKWHKYNSRLLQEWELGHKIKAGYTVLFHGPSGTGKTITAALLGKRLEASVFKIDLSQVVSKYIGETEKNLEKVFTAAEGKDWILFFDEADALFGKRTDVKDAHDRYANQEIAYLFQRLENFDGLVVLATRSKAAIDPAFLRRFNLLVEFPLPTGKEREQLWKSSIPSKAVLAKDVNLKKLSSDYDLSGASILNVIHYASLQAMSKNTDTITKEDLLEGLRQQYEKESREFRNSKN